MALNEKKTNKHIIYIIINNNYNNNNINYNFNFNFISILCSQRNHYNELTDEVKNIFGSIPVDYANYWLNKFPQLPAHVYHSMQRCGKEPSMSRFYIRYYTFTKPDYLSDTKYDNVELAELIQKIRADYGYGNGTSDSTKNFNINWNWSRGNRGYYNFKTLKNET